VAEHVAYFHNASSVVLTKAKGTPTTYTFDRKFDFEFKPVAPKVDVAVKHKSRVTMPTESKKFEFETKPSFPVGWQKYAR
jgi:hypothetical protein